MFAIERIMLPGGRFTNNAEKITLRLRMLEKRAGGVCLDARERERERERERGSNRRLKKIKKKFNNLCC
jgi:hypothetical protein